MIILLNFTNFREVFSPSYTQAYNFELCFGVSYTSVSQYLGSHSPPEPLLRYGQRPQSQTVKSLLPVLVGWTARFYNK